MENISRETTIKRALEQAQKLQELLCDLGKSAEHHETQALLSLEQTKYHLERMGHLALFKGNKVFFQTT